LILTFFNSNTQKFRPFVIDKFLITYGTGPLVDIRYVETYYLSGH